MDDILEFLCENFSDEIEEGFDEAVDELDEDEIEDLIEFYEGDDDDVLDENDDDDDDEDYFEEDDDDFDEDDDELTEAIEYLIELKGGKKGKKAKGWTKKTVPTWFKASKAKFGDEFLAKMDRYSGGDKTGKMAAAAMAIAANRKKGKTKAVNRMNSAIASAARKKLGMKKDQKITKKHVIAAFKLGDKKSGGAKELAHIAGRALGGAGKASKRGLAPSHAMKKGLLGRVLKTHGHGKFGSDMDKSQAARRGERRAIKPSKKQLAQRKKMAAKMADPKFRAELAKARAAAKRK